MNTLHPHFQSIVDMFIKPLLIKNECAQCGANFGVSFSHCFEHNAQNFHVKNDANALKLQVNSEGKV